MAEARVGSGKVALFRQESPGGLTYRIPALIYLPSESAFLAFAEERSSPSDNDAKSLVMRRGEKEGESVQWGPQEALATARLPDYRTMCPCPVQDRKSGTIFLFFICVEKRVSELRQGRNGARLCHVSSQDGGRTWRQLTNRVIGEDLRKWATFGVRPGHGLQLRSGRLVIPAYTYYIHKRCCGLPICCCTKPHSFIFYSDDGGRNFRLSGGPHWGKMQKMVAGFSLGSRNSTSWGPQEALATARLPDYRTMCPCPVQDRKSGTIFLFFICVEKHVSELRQIKSGRNAARLCHVSSQDGGRTWSQLTDLTDWVIGEDLRNWATFAVGTGHGLQASSGRLMIPAHTYYIHKRCCGLPICCCTKPHCFIFYSDDGGQDWARGQLVTALRAGECQVAELTRPDGSPVLYCNARSPDEYRVEAFSTDDGNQFKKSFLCEDLPETGNGCQGSVVSFTPDPLDLNPSASLKTPEQWLLFCHPTDSRKRVNLGIFLNTSPLEKGNWKPPWVLYEGPSGYSDLAVCEEDQPPLFGCLFECGVSSELEEIAFQLFRHSEERE